MPLQHRVLNLLQALARARARIARDEHIEHVEGHDVQREEANTRSLVNLIHRNNLLLRQQQPQLQVRHRMLRVFSQPMFLCSVHL
jgi:hypothetical protein